MTSPRKTKLLQLVQDRYDAAAKNQEYKIGEWERARLFYRGDHWLEGVGNRFRPASRPKWRSRITVNKLPPIVELSIANFLHNRPIAVGIPGSDDEEDRKAARLAEALTRYFWDYLDYDDKLHELLTGMFVYGDYFARMSWDPGAGDKIQLSEPMLGPDGAPIVGPDGNEIRIPTESKPEGQPKIDLIDPFSLGVEPGALRLEDAAWVTVTEILRKGELERRFKEKIPDEDVGNDQEASYIPAQIGRAGTQPQKDRVALKTMYERPTKKYERGRVVYATNSAILGEDELDGGKHIPIVHFQDIRLIGEFYGTSRVTQAIPLQAELNRTRSQLVENRNLSSRPKIIAAQGALEDGTVSSQPGEIIEFDVNAAAGHVPMFLDPPGVPQYVLQEVAWIIEDINDLTSRHEASQGKMSSSATSGKMFQSQRQSDDTRNTPAIRKFERGLGQLSGYLMTLLQLYATSERVVTIIGKNRQPESTVFKGSDLSDKTNVRFEIASQMAWNRESQRQQLFWMYSQGLLDKEELLERIQWPSTQYEYELDQEHRANQRMETELLIRGQPIEPLDTDDHDVHLQEIERHINSPENYRLYIAPGGREMLQFLLQHAEQHKQKLPQPPEEPAQKRLQLHGEIHPQLVNQIAQQELQGGAPGAAQPEEEPQKPQGAGMATPPGGMSGEAYGPGPQ
jgi:hypothetical protein